jgi:tRNA(Arg) A34 adenosine deaminase TadA
MCLAAIYWARIDRIYFANDRTEAALTAPHHRPLQNPSRTARASSSRTVQGSFARAPPRAGPVEEQYAAEELPAPEAHAD